MGPARPIPAPPAPTHPRKGLPGVEVGLAPRLQGLLQLLPPPPPPSRRRSLSPSRCSACCHRRAKPGRRRAVPGLGVCYPAAPGPPPRLGRPFSTADSGQPERSQRSQAERNRAPRSARPPVSRSAAGARRTAFSFLQPPPHPTEEAASTLRARLQERRATHEATRGSPQRTGRASSSPVRAGISALLPPSGLDKGELSVSEGRRAAESSAQPLKMRENGPEPDPALRALSQLNRGQRALALRLGPGWEGFLAPLSHTLGL